MTEAVTYNAAANRYEMNVDGHTVFADVRRDGEILHINYVEAPPALRGTGAAGRFMQGLMDIVKSENLKVIPRCGYAAAWIDRHGDYKDLVA